MSDFMTLLERGLPENLSLDHHQHTHDDDDDHHDGLLMDGTLGMPEFELSDYLLIGGGSEEDSTSSTVVTRQAASTNQISPQHIEDPIQMDYKSLPKRSNMYKKCKGDNQAVKKLRMDMGFRIAFKTKSELDIMDDGFKWRKYGKKSVKNSPNPRNYYRCSSRGCQVKKRVERDREDSSYVITTYDGVHNHESPCVVYYNQMPLMVPTGWTLQASHSSSS